MYGTLKKIFAFAGSKKGLLKKSLLFAFMSGLFSAMQFAALFVVIGALVSDNRDGKFIWLSLGIMAVSLIGRIPPLLLNGRSRGNLLYPTTMWQPTPPTEPAVPMPTRFWRIA